MSIKITVTKDLDIDLNAYYPQFPRALREAISEAIVDLAGGLPRKRPNAGDAKASGWGDTARLTHDLRSARLAVSPQRHGTTLVVYRILAQKFGDNEFLMGDAKKAIISDAHVEASKVTTILSNMWANGNLIVNELR